MVTIEEQIQKLNAEELISLYQLDLTSIDSTAPIYYFTNGAVANEVILFNGVTYVPVDVEVEGFEWNGQGACPRPKVKITNVNNVVLAVTITYGDCIGATFRRIRTFKRFLDGESDADPTQIMPMDVYRVERKTNMNATEIEWELSIPFDQEGLEIPKRMVLKDSCTHIYRKWDALTSSFDYSKATCPYAAAIYFTKTGTSTVDPSKDQCSKRLTSGCRLRYGDSPLPTRAFPGVGDVG